MLASFAWFALGLVTGGAVVYVIMAVWREPWDDDDWPNG